MKQRREHGGLIQDKLHLVQAILAIDECCAGDVNRLAAAHVAGVERGIQGTARTNQNAVIRYRGIVNTCREHAARIGQVPREPVDVGAADAALRIAREKNMKRLVVEGNASRERAAEE